MATGLPFHRSHLRSRRHHALPCAPGQARLRVPGSFEPEEGAVLFGCLDPYHNRS